MSDRDHIKEGLRIVIDSNVFIAAEILPGPDDGHSNQAAQFLRLASELGFRLVLSSSTKDDLLNAPDDLRKIRQKQLRKYVVLPKVAHSPDLANRAGFPSQRSPNDEADLSVLAVLDVGAANWLVTQDSNLRKRAGRAGFGESVFSLAEAIETLESLQNKPSNLVEVRTVKGYEVNLAAPIFDSLRSDYTLPGSVEFDNWWKSKVANESRDVLILGDTDDPEGVAALKIEEDNPHGLSGRVLKICTFKISEKHSGTKRGELLLRAIINYGRRNNCKRTYVEALPDKVMLTGWLLDFGFTIARGATTSRGEHVLVKELEPSPMHSHMRPLEFNVTFGPGALKIERIHIVPIRAEWHGRLLREAEPQLHMFARDDACGNAIRKAYLSHSPTRKVHLGDALLFLRTGGPRQSAATAIGVTEDVCVSRDPGEIMAFVGNRTVYTANEVRELCSSGEVLAIRFRMDQILSSPWTASTLQKNGVLRGSAQSIQLVSENGTKWIRQKLGESS